MRTLQFGKGEARLSAHNLVKATKLSFKVKNRDRVTTLSPGALPYLEDKALTRRLQKLRQDYLMKYSPSLVQDDVNC